MTILRTFSYLLTALSLAACSGSGPDAKDRSVSSGVAGTDQDVDGGGGGVECPEVMLPPKCDCPNGQFVPQKDDAGCTRSFQCVEPPICPVVMIPEKSQCPNGKFVPERDQYGCVRGFACVPNPPCPPIALPSPDSCQGVWVQKLNANGCPNFECVAATECPQVMLPPADACQGTWVQKLDANGCVGFECRP